MTGKLFLHGIKALKRQKVYVIINILGLSVGLAASLIILLFIFNETSYDKYNEHYDRIYRVILDGKMGEQEVKAAYTASPIGPYMKNEFPEVEAFTRWNPWGETVLKIDDRSIAVEEFVETDSSFFTIFSIALLSGDPSSILNEPRTLVLSQTTANKLFGTEEVVGKTLKVGNDTIPYRITGIMEDFPERSHFHANILSAFMTNPRSDDDQWLANSFGTYVLLSSASVEASVNDKFPKMIVERVGDDLQQYMGVTVDEFLSHGNRYDMYLQPLADIHMEPDIQHSVKPATDPRYLKIFGIVALLIIVIASINFMNLSTAQGIKRAREVGIKKVSGSPRLRLVNQFLAETILLTLFSLLLALILVQVSIPYLNQLIGASIDIHFFSSWYIIPLLILFSVIVGIFAGIYPAFFLSSFKPVSVLKDLPVKMSKGAGLRSILVILQFSISVVLIIGTMIMARQIRYMVNKDLGFQKEGVMVISRGGTIGDKMSSFKQELLRIPEVQSVTGSTAVPGHNNNTNGYSLEGRSDESLLLETNWVDHDFWDTYGIELVDGRKLDDSRPGDRSGVLINQAAVRSFAIEDPLSTRFINRDNDLEAEYLNVVGVTRDFHFQSLRTVIRPYIFRFKEEQMHWGYISIRLGKNADHTTISKIENTWKQFTRNDPMKYFFLDEDLAAKYKQERQNLRLAILFAVLGIFIASLGLLGLTSFTVQVRTREIGIRKAMGASTSGIFMLIAKNIIILVVISTVISWPVIYFLSEKWLQNFYYRIELSAMDFVPAMFIALAVAILTIAYRVLKTARVNPSDSLRYE
jgi:putative ABC transport system permease protein